TAVPAKGNEPLPPAKRSRISPPLPVAAPLKGSTVVGKLWVSAFREITLSKSFSSYQSGLSPLFGAHCFTFGPFTKATLSLYAETISFGFSADVFLISLNREEGISLPSISKVPLKIL